MATILVVSAAVVLLTWLRRGQSTQPRISQLTANPAGDRVRAAAISPDGRYLAFADETGLYLRTVEGGETHPIKVPEEFKVSGTTWFPDGAHMMVALAKSGQKSGLWDLSVPGGGFRQIADDGFAPAISPDGKRVAFVKGSKTHQQLWIMGSDGSQPEMLAGDEGDYFGQVVWSPEGQRIAYSRGKLTYGYGIRLGIETMDLKSRSVRRCPGRMDSIYHWPGVRITTLSTVQMSAPAPSRLQPVVGATGSRWTGKRRSIAH